MAIPLNNATHINQQFANKLASGQGSVADNLRSQSGVTQTAKKSTVGKGGRIQEEGSQLSPAAREALKSEQAQYADHVAEHGHEMAQQSGLDVPSDDYEEAELQRKRGYDRDQEFLAEGPTADGQSFVMASPDGTQQVIPVEDHQFLTTKMDDPDFTDARLLDDIPAQNLEAANSVMDTQLAQGASKVAVLKTDPKIDAVAEEMEIQPAPPLAEPMDILDCSNDPKLQPLSMELPDEVHQVAAEMAAAQLAAGEQPEALIAGGMPGMDASQPVAGAEPIAAATADPALQKADELTAKFDKILDEREGRVAGYQPQIQRVISDSYDRMHQAGRQLPPEAREAINAIDKDIREHFLSIPGNKFDYDQQRMDSNWEDDSRHQWWEAHAAQKFAADPQAALKAIGADPEMKLDPALLKDLRDGSRQYLQGLEEGTWHKPGLLMDSASKARSENAEMLAYLGTSLPARPPWPQPERQPIPAATPAEPEAAPTSTLPPAYRPMSALPPAWTPTYMPYANSYPNYMTYPPVNYGGYPGGGWNSWGGMGFGGYGGSMGPLMNTLALSNMISNLTFPLMMFAMF